MIASIVPVKRLPRHSFLFDYKIPTELESKVAVGQLIIIELRKKLEFGIIVALSTEENSSYAYKEITKLVHEVPLIPDSTQKLLVTISKRYGTALSTIYKTTLLPLQKRKLKSIALEPGNKKYVRETMTEEYFLYRDASEYSALFSKINTEHSTLITVPEVQYIQLVKNEIEKKIAMPIIEWHSDMSQKEKFDIWLRIRNNTGPIVVIGTRSALTLPFITLDTIIMDREHDDQYKSYDQQPKIHAKDIVPLLGELHKAHIIYSSFSPSFESYYKISKEQLPCTVGESTYTGGLLFNSKQSLYKGIRFIEHTPLAKSSKICSLQTEDELLKIGSEGTHDAVVIVQRKGFATSVVCRDCGHIERSEKTGLPMVYQSSTNTLYSSHEGESKPLPLSCPVCGSTIIVLSGIGTEQVESYLIKLFRDNTITTPIIRIDETTPLSPKKFQKTQSAILVGTEKALPYIRGKQTALYTILDIDRQLAIPEYTATERALHLVDELCYLSEPESQLILETTSTNKPFFTFASAKDRLYRTELSFRQQLGYPPYKLMVKYTLGSLRPHDARRTAEDFARQILVTLTEHNISASLDGPYETHPRFDKRMYWWGILLKINHSDINLIVRHIHSSLPTSCIVDIHPISILSP